MIVDPEFNDRLEEEDETPDLGDIITVIFVPDQNDVVVVRGIGTSTVAFLINPTSPWYSRFKGETRQRQLFDILSEMRSEGKLGQYVFS